jgi:hypothetical protein
MKLVRAMVIALSATAFLFAQAAAPAPEAKASKAAKKEVVKVLTGKLVSVDAVGNTIVVLAKKANDTISVDAAAKITSGKKEIALADLKADVKVAVSYKIVDGKKVASKVKEEVAAPAKAKKAKKAAKADAAAPAATEPAAK